MPSAAPSATSRSMRRSQPGAPLTEAQLACYPGSASAYWRVLLARARVMRAILTSTDFNLEDFHFGDLVMLREDEHCAEDMKRSETRGPVGKQ